MEKNQNFLSPNSICLIAVLYEYSQNKNEINTNSSIANFLTNKILDVTKNDQLFNLDSFLHELFSTVQNQTFCSQFLKRIHEFDNINSLYKYLSTSLKGLRILRNSRLEQGSLIDLFIRRCYLAFSKQNFQELIEMHEEFQKFKNNVIIEGNEKKRYNQFSLQKDILYIQNQIQNFSHCFDYETIASEIKELGKYKKNNQFCQLKFLNQAAHNRERTAHKNLHKYFDKIIGQLVFRDKNDSLQNFIHKPILNQVYLNLQMKCFDEALRGISETLRISQKNSDDESINYCLIYLYQIAGKLGHYQDENMLVEHAISHSLTVDHPDRNQLLLHSCLYLLHNSSHYELNNLQLLKMRKINWINSIHQAYKKVISEFKSDQALGLLEKSKYSASMYEPMLRLEQGDMPRAIFTVSFLQQFVRAGCQNLVMFYLDNLFGNLEEICQSSVLVDSLYQFAYNLVDWNLDSSIELINKLTVNQQIEFSNQQQFYSNLMHIKMFINRNDFESAYSIEQATFKLIENEDPLSLTKIWTLRNLRMITEGNLNAAFDSINEQIIYNENKGFEKMNLTLQIQKIELFYQMGNLVEALSLTLSCISRGKQFEIIKERVIAKIYLSLIKAQLGNIETTLKIIKNLENNYIFNNDLEVRELFYYAKGIIIMMLSQNQEDSEKINTIKIALEQFTHSLKINIKLNKIGNCQKIYYLQARLFEAIGFNEERDKASKYFSKCNALISKFNQNKTISFFNINGEQLLSIQQNLISIVQRALHPIEINQKN